MLSYVFASWVKCVGPPEDNFVAASFDSEISRKVKHQDHLPMYTSS